jgi:hypothetical protein
MHVSFYQQSNYAAQLTAKLRSIASVTDCKWTLAHMTPLLLFWILLFCDSLCSVNYLEFTERFYELSWNSQNKKEVTLHDHNTTKSTNCYEHKITSNWRLVYGHKALQLGWSIWRHSLCKSSTMTALDWLPSSSVFTITRDTKRAISTILHQNEYKINGLF